MPTARTHAHVEIKGPSKMQCFESQMKNCCCCRCHLFSDVASYYTCNQASNVISYFCYCMHVRTCIETTTLLLFGRHENAGVNFMFASVCLSNKRNFRILRKAKLVLVSNKLASIVEKVLLFA